jgi:predicted DNA-binding protein (UPF0251 family)
MELKEQITVLERALQEHIRKWERFFSGVDRVPPQDERERISRRLRTLSEQTVHRRAEQFRIEQLQHRFMTYSQNWERMLREREEGRTVQPHTNPELRAQTAPNTASRVSVDKDEGEALFDRYRAAKSKHGSEVGVDRATFDKQIAVQRQKIEERLGRKVRFDIQIDGDKVRVVARKQKG